MQEVLSLPLVFGAGKRSWLPRKSDSSMDKVNPRQDRRVYFSIAQDWLPRGGVRAAASADRAWQETPGKVNLAFVSAAPDAYALQRAFWVSRQLATAAVLLPDSSADKRYMQSTAIDLLDGPFLGKQPLRTDFQWAQAIPRTGDLRSTDWRVNHDGFLDMNGVVGLLDTVQLLPLSAAQQLRFWRWVRCAAYAKASQDALHLVAYCTTCQCSSSPIGDHNLRQVLDLGCRLLTLGGRNTHCPVSSCSYLCLHAGSTIHGF